jgi:hypoxanthine phosphoribosyltransferase
MNTYQDLTLLHTSWADVEHLSEVLADKILASGFFTDIIVAISRGGFDPARILCDKLRIRRLASIQIEFYSGVQDTINKPRIIYPLNAEVKNLNVLIVDDVSDTGISLKVAKEHVLAREPQDLKIATLHIKPWTSFRPDYHALDTNKWIVYPWEPIESMLSIAERLEKKGYTKNQIKERLLELGFNKKTLEKL